MSNTYRSNNDRDYWQKRWNQLEVDSEITNEDDPLKDMLKGVVFNVGSIPVSNFGDGRVLKFFYNYGYKMIEIDYILTAVSKIKEPDGISMALVTKILDAGFGDLSIHTLFAFGLFHNLETELEDTMPEMLGIRKDSGLRCASFPGGKLYSRLTDWLGNHRRSGSKPSQTKFYLANFRARELMDIFSLCRFELAAVYPVENMSIFYRLAIFRQKSHLIFNEHANLTNGYRLSPFGKTLNKFAFTLFPTGFCNV